MKILLATDGSKESDAALEMLKKFSFSKDGEIRIISIVDMAVPLALNIYEGYFPSTLEIENTAKENAKENTGKYQSYFDRDISGSTH